MIPVALFDVLDGKCSDDYVARVEPSASGGEKMADLILDKLLVLSDPAVSGGGYVRQASPPPATSYMSDRS